MEAERKSTDRETPTKQLTLPADKKRRKSPTPGAGRSGRSQSRGRSMTPSRFRSMTPSGHRSITPFLNREEKEKTPFEIGPNIIQQLASQKAIIDKALVMDISEKEEDIVKYITSEQSVIDRAAVMDVSNVTIIYVEDDYEYDEEYPESEESASQPESKEASVEPAGSQDGGDDDGEGSEAGDKKKKGKKAKKVVKKKAEKEKKEDTPPKLKLDMGGPPKVNKMKLFEEKKEDPKSARPPPAKRAPGKIGGAFAAMEEAAKAEKPETLEERKKRMQEEKEAKEREEEEARLREEEEALMAEMENEDGEHLDDEENMDGEEANGEGEEGEEEHIGEEDGVLDDELQNGERSRSSSVEEFTRPNIDDAQLWKIIEDDKGIVRAKFERKYFKHLTERERDVEWQMLRERLRRPRILTHLSDRMCTEGGTIKLICTASGPELNIKWFKDGKLVERDATHRIVANEGILTLEVLKTTTRDSGEYSVYISNDNGDVSSSAIVTVYDVVKEEPMPPTFITVRDYYHLYDDELTIEVHIRGTPRPKVVWKHDVIEVKPSFKYTILEEAHGVHKLLIYKPTNRDAGKYVCVATNKVATNEIVHEVHVAKPLNYHIPGIYHAKNEIMRQKEEEARRQMDEAMKSKSESDAKYGAQDYVSNRYRDDAPTPVTSKNRLKFATQLRDRTAVIGQKIKFSCSIYGPDPQARWLKDDQPLVYGPTIRNMSAEGVSIVELSDVTKKSSGQYKCVARNQYSEITTSCYLKVYDAKSNEEDLCGPIIALSIKEVFHPRENDLVIDCKVRGNPRPTITWLKDDAPIELDERMQQIEHNDGVCELIINKPSQRDCGTYTVVATNNLGTHKTSHLVEIQTPAVSRLESKRSSISGASSRASEPAMVNGDAKNENGTDAATGGGGDTEKKSRSKPPSTPKVEEEYVRRYGPSDPVPLKNKLNFVTHLCNRTIAVGAKVKLSCVLQGPDPSIRWLKNEQPLTYSPRLRNLSQDGMCILEMQSVTMDDAGDYTCVARNQTNEVTSCCTVYVYDTKQSNDFKPTFTRAIKDWYSIRANEIVIECHVHGVPKSKITWLKDSIKLEKSEKYVMAHDDDGKVELFISYPNNTDSGKYTCQAENVAGNAEIHHQVCYQSKEVYVTDNYPGVFHHDQERVERAKSEVREIEEELHITPSISAQEWREYEKIKSIESSAPASRAGELAGLAVDALESLTPSQNEIDSITTVDNSGLQTPNELSGELKLGTKPKKITKLVEPELYERRHQVEAPPDYKMNLHFTTFLTDRTIEIGNKVRLSCFVDGPDPNYRWLKNGLPLTYSPRCRNVSADSLGALELTNLTLADSGVYTCVVRNPITEIFCSCKLIVFEVLKEHEQPPYFVRALRETYHASLKELMLECDIHGSPIPSVTWFKNGQQLIESGQIKLNEFGNTRQLIIKNATLEHGGVYKCVLINDRGKKECSTEVDMYYHLKLPIQPTNGKTDNKHQSEQPVEPTGKQKPIEIDSFVHKQRIQLESFLKNMTIEEGSKAKFLFSVRGDEPQITWFKDGKPITLDSRIRQSLNEGLVIFEISNTQCTDSGQYKCVIRNERNEVLTASQLLVYEKLNEISTPLAFSRSLTETYDPIKNEIILSCAVRGRPKISWFKDNYNISTNRYRTLDEAGGVRKLVIKNPVPSDFGCYTCRAEESNQIDEISITINEKRITEQKNIHLDNMKRQQLNDASDRTNDSAYGSRSKSTELDHGKELNDKMCHGKEIYYKDPKRKPIFSTELRDRNATEKNKIRIVCNVIGVDVSITWLKNDQIVSNSSKCRASFNDGLAVLEIYSTDPSDSGMYSCVAQNIYGESSTSAKLKVYADHDISDICPIFTRSIRDTYSLHEDSLVLECHVRANPKPSITWTKDNSFLQLTSRIYQIDAGDGCCKLIISKPTPRDSGIYTCVAENKVGEEKISHTVDYNGRHQYIEEKAHGFFHVDFNKPHFENQLGDHIVTHGGTLGLQAEILHSPSDVQWFLDKKPIQMGDKVMTLYDHVTSTHALVINQVNEDEHCGTYTCRAANPFGKAEAIANVHIVKGLKCPLFLSRPEKDMLIMPGDPFSLSFRVQGDPAPRLIFMKGTQDITNGDRVLKEAHDDYIRFTVQKAEISDSGTYWVVARSPLGTDRTFCTVTVKPRARSSTPMSRSRYSSRCDYDEFALYKNPPGPIPSEPIITDYGRNHVCLSWEKPTDCDFSPVVAYRVDAWIVGRDGFACWEELGVTPTPNFDAFNLKTDCEYLFRVTPKNRYGWGKSIQTTYPIFVGNPQTLPEFTKILPGQMKAMLGHTIVLDCIVTGTPKPYINWFRDGHRVRNSDRINIMTSGSNCQLYIRDFCISDEGRYSCEATNSKGRVSTFARLQIVNDLRIFEADTKLKKFIEGDLKCLDEDMLPQFTMRLRDRRIQAGNPVRLICQAIASPPCNVDWYKNGNLIQISDVFDSWTENNVHTLEIRKTRIDDCGVYTATASNELGSVSCHCNLIVDTGIRGYIAPEFYCDPDPVLIVKVGNEIRIATQIEAYPSVGVNWFKDGVRLRPSRQITTALDPDGFVELVIPKAKSRDAGVYSCVASNIVGRTETSCRVTVESESIEDNCFSDGVPQIHHPNMPYSKEPMFVIKPRSTNVYEGDNVIISCEVVGDPKPDVMWLRDFLKPDYYKDAPHFRRIGDGPQYRLEIPKVKLDFTGTYSVIATNCHGEVKAVISLQVYAKDLNNDSTMAQGQIKLGNVETLPEIRKHLKDVRCCDGDSIRLECQVVGKPEPIIIWEKDGRVLPQSPDFVTDYDGERATLTIVKVYPEDEGEYTCIASNNLGRSYSAACILVDVPEEKENLISKQLTRPAGLLTPTSTPRSTPRTTPVRLFSPLPMPCRNNSIDINNQNQRLAAPKFFALPHSKIVEEGDSVQFQCAIAGHPLPWASWDKEGIIITPTARINIIERDDLRILTIDEVTFEDAGLYRITLENDYGRIEATAKLDVISGQKRRGAPSIRTTSSSPRIVSSRRLMGNSTRIGGRMALACKFRGSSVPARKFYHNGEEVKESDRIHIRTERTQIVLEVNPVKWTDAGEYVVVAENEDSIATTAMTVTIIEDDEDIPQIPPCLYKPQEDIESTEGIPLELECELDSNEPFEYHWLFNGKLIMDCDEFCYIDHGNGLIVLRINDPFIYDSGVYTCVIATMHGKCEKEFNVKIHDLYYNLNEVPKAIFEKQLIPVVAVRGSVVSFCTRVSPSNAAVKWHVCGRPVTQDARGISIENHPDGVRILHILGIDYKHSGEVKCTAILSSQRIKIPVICTTELAVLPSYGHSHITNGCGSVISEQADIPSYIIRGPDDCTVLVGGKVTLDALFCAHPKPKIKWLKAGRPVVEDKFIKVNTTSSRSTLSIRNITADQSGKYSLEIMNEYGSDVASASVAVESPPDPPGGQPSVSAGPDRISVAWCGPPYDGGCMITGFFVEMQKNNDEWQEIAHVSDTLAYTVTNIEPNIRYRFRVRAENIHGKSEPSECSDYVSILPNQNRKFSVLEGGDFKTRFELQDELGKGRFGVVYKVRERDTGAILAAKIIKCIKAKDRLKVQEEIEIMKSLQHPKLLQLAASFESTREIVMVMEYITGGELFERVVADDFTLTERDCILFVRQICEGVAYMHEKNIVHLDLKPENVMCHTRTSHQIKIIDFGLAKKLTSNDGIRVLFGTPEFIAPEIINYEPISDKSDMWSIGVICYVLLSGLSPFMGDTDADTFANITSAEFDFDDESFDAVSQDAKDFISSLLVHRKEKRLSANECLESKWLTDHDEKRLSSVKICTDKLKKFIIRRKWQKTGNAIRALGRMASLSASRRNSLAAGLAVSPRPSIATSLLSASLLHKLNSLREEEDKTNENTNDNEKHEDSTDNGFLSTSPTIPQFRNNRESKICTERSDSGFSECSTCSATSPYCVCANQTVHKELSILEESPPELEVPQINLMDQLQHALLKSKLDGIAENQNNSEQSESGDDCTSSLASLSVSNGSDFLKSSESQLELKEFDDNNYENCLINEITISLTTNTNVNQKKEQIMNKALPEQRASIEKEPIMKSDFTNTVVMRKKSLELKVHNERLHSKKIYENPGKVLKLAQKFSNSGAEVDSNDNQVGNKATTSNNKYEKFSPVMSPVLASKRNVFERLSVSNKSPTNQERKCFKNSVSHSVESDSPPSTHRLSTLRLKGRVKEVTERLSAPKKPSTSTACTKEQTTSAPSTPVPRDKKLHRSNSFKKTIQFWKC